jgi:hypothetical protein
MKFRPSCLGSLLVAVLCSCAWSQTSPSGSELQPQLHPTNGAVTQETYRLEYNLKADERLVYRVEHVATVDTMVQGNRQTSKSRSLVTKAWLVQRVDSDGTVHIAHSIEDVDMWSQVDGRQPVRYQSRNDKDAPLEYEKVAQTVGKQLSVVSMDRRGQVEAGRDPASQTDSGFGGSVVPLPPAAVKIGATWSVPSAVRVLTADGSFKSIKTEQLYELTSVDAGVATILVTTQVLAPNDDPRIRLQLVQSLTNGEIEFDIVGGRVLSRKMQWNESVADFGGPKSHMKYVAEFSETLLPDDMETARRPSS